jgi:hypothetical protein
MRPFFPSFPIAAYFRITLISPFRSNTIFRTSSRLSLFNRSRTLSNKSFSLIITCRIFCSSIFPSAYNTFRSPFTNRPITSLRTLIQPSPECTNMEAKEAQQLIAKA